METCCALTWLARTLFSIVPGRFCLANSIENPSYHPPIHWTALNFTQILDSAIFESSLSESGLLYMCTIYFFVWVATHLYFLYESGQTSEEQSLNTPDDPIKLKGGRLITSFRLSYYFVVRCIYKKSKCLFKTPWNWPLHLKI